MSKLYRGPSIDASHQVSVHLAMQFQRRRFKKNRPIRNNNCLWWPCLLMNRKLVGSMYGRFSIDIAHLVLICCGFRGEDLKKIVQSETTIACGGHVC
jgi:hypothetical protein